MEPWTVSNGIWVPQISLCRGPGRFNHQWGVNTQGKKVYARAGSMLQYSYDGNAGDPPVVCDNPTYPGEAAAAALAGTQNQGTVHESQRCVHAVLSVRLFSCTSAVQPLRPAGASSECTSRCRYV
jgi:hypothetical protein